LFVVTLTWLQVRAHSKSRASGQADSALDAAFATGWALILAVFHSGASAELAVMVGLVPTIHVFSRRAVKT